MTSFDRARSRKLAYWMLAMIVASSLMGLATITSLLSGDFVRAADRIVMAIVLYLCFKITRYLRNRAGARPTVLDRLP